MIHILQEPGKVDLQSIECVKNDCGFFDEHTGLCSQVALVRGLTAIGDILGRIADNLPASMPEKTKQ